MLDKARLAVQCLLALKLAMHSVQAIAVRSMLAARPWELGKTLLTVHCVLASQSLTVHFMEMVYGDSLYRYAALPRGVSCKEALTGSSLCKYWFVTKRP